MPTTAINAQSRRVRGQAARRANTISIRIREERTNRMPANVIGGRSARPSLMNSQVEPQMTQRISQTMRAFIWSFVREAALGRQSERGSSPTVREGFVRRIAPSLTVGLLPRLANHF